MGQSASCHSRSHHHRHRHHYPPPCHCRSFRPPQPLFVFSDLLPPPPPPPSAPPTYAFASNPGTGWLPPSSSSSSSLPSSNEVKVPSRQLGPYAERQRPLVVTNTVNLHKDSIRLEPDEFVPDHHLLSFTFDSSVDGSFTIFYFAKEGKNCSFSQVYPDMRLPVRVPFAKGFCQKFRQPPGSGLDFCFFDLDELSKPLDGDAFPLVVYAEASPSPLSKDELIGQSTAIARVQITQAVFKKNDHGPFHVKVMKQILWVDGERYELLDIFNVGVSAEAEFGDDNPEKECVICMSEAKDTTVLPCRHMCMCSKCAKAIRLNSNKCPICRQPIEQIVEIPNYSNMTSTDQGRIIY